MKIGLDLTAIIHQRGVSMYTSNLVAALVELGKDEIFGFGTSLRARKLLISKALSLGIARENLEVGYLPISVLELVWRLGFRGVRQSLPQIEVYHSWDWLQPPDENLPLVSNIHDLAMLKFPESAHRGILARHQRSWEILKKRQARVVTISQSSKRDIVELLGIPANLVSVTYPALPDQLVKAADNLTEDKLEQIKAQLGLDRPFILAVGTREPRKNLERLIKAWQPLSTDYDLIIAGARGWDKSNQLSNIKGLRFVDQLSSSSLAVLYEEAKLLAYPSLYEGFGFPILEAFHFGTPVVTSNTSSMPEVAGNAAELIDPLDVDSIRQGLTTILSENIKEQQQRLQKMIIRLHAFSWRQTALDTRKVYQKAIEDFS